MDNLVQAQRSSGKSPPFHNTPNKTSIFVVFKPEIVVFKPDKPDNHPTFIIQN